MFTISSGANVAFCSLNFVAHLSSIGALRALHCLDQNHEAIIGVTAEGRNRLAGFLLIGARIIQHNRLLRIVGWKLFRNKKRSGRQSHTFRRRAGEFDELLGGYTVALVQRQCDSKLAIVARDNRRTLAKPCDSRQQARPPCCEYW